MEPDTEARRTAAAFKLQPDHEPQTLAFTDETQTPSLLKMTLHRLTLKGAQKKDKTPSELQWN